MFATGAAFIAIGLATSNPAFWIPGCVFMAIGGAQRVKRWG
ncbi:Uncharacterised protein [Paucimonas lemoignei]|nr:Uncharacterised protein [Paucimonas lemoignei]